jgi:hypothetical protein
MTTTLATLVVTNPFSEQSLTFQLPYPDAQALFTQKKRELPGLLSSSLFTVRTNHLTNFTKDFFCPTLVHCANRVECCVARFLTMVAAFFWDLITLPIRALTLLPMIIYNCVQPQHEIITVLKRAGIRADFSPEIIQVHTEYYHAMRSSEETDEENHVKVLEVHARVFGSTEMFNLIDVPYYSEEGRRVAQHVPYYLHEDRCTVEKIDTRTQNVLESRVSSEPLTNGSLFTTT